MAKLPPGNCKALAQEIKQIAKELAALSKELGNSGGSLGHMPSMSVASGEASADSGSEEMAGVDTSTELANSVQDTCIAELATSDGAQADAALAAETAEAEAHKPLTCQQNLSATLTLKLMNSTILRRIGFVQPTCARVKMPTTKPCAPSSMKPEKRSRKC